PSIPLQRIYRLNQTFTETGFSNHDRTIGILQSAGNDFRSAGTVLIDQHDNRIQVVAVDFLRCVRAIGTTRTTTGFNDQLPLLQERLTDLDRFSQQAAGISAKIEDETVHILIVQLLQCIAKFLTAGLGQTIQLDVADTWLDQESRVDRV